MRRSLTLLATLACAALVAAGCSTTASALAVGQTTVTQAELVAQARAYEASPMITGSTVPAKKPPTVSTQITANLVKTDIANALVNRILARKGVKVTGLEKQLVKSQLAAQANGGSLAKGLAPAFESYLVDEEAGTLALEASLGKVDLSEAGIRSYYNAHANLFNQVCIEDALYATQSAAQAAQTSIAGGASFATATSSAQQTSGSTPDCNSIAPLPASLQQAIISTPVGHVGPVVPVSSGPSQTGAPPATGYAVFSVISEKPVPFSTTAMPAVASQMLQVASSASLQSEVEALVKAEALGTRITVNPADGKLKIGNGQLLGFDVTAPAAPAASSLPSSTTTSTPVSLPGLSGG